MDSCNSSSLQSSVGGDEESVTSFLISPTTNLNFTPLSRHRSPPSAAVSGPISGYLDAIGRLPPLPPCSSNPNSVLNLDLSWARGLCSSDHPNCTNADSAQVAPPPPPYTFTLTQLNTTTNSFPSPSSSTSRHPHPATPATEPPEPAAAGASGAAQSRGSKKRARPSKRAPTTVLMTDTSNFRAMVQEFTGGVPPLPSPFFSPAFPRSGGWFDRFPAAASPKIAHSPLRPFAHKAPVLPSLISSPAISTPSDATVTVAGRTSANTSVERAAAGTATVITPVGSNRTATSGSYQSLGLPSDHSLGNQHHDLLNFFSFQSPMQPSHASKYSSLDVPNLTMGKALQGWASPATAAEGYAIDGGIRHDHTSPGTSSTRGGGGGDAPQWAVGSSSAGGGDRGQFRPPGRSSGDGRQSDA